MRENGYPNFFFQNAMVVTVGKSWGSMHDDRLPHGDPGATAVQLKPADFRVRVPTLVIWGEADTALPVTLLDGLTELVDDLTVHRLPRATHWLAHEEPDEVARLIFDFIGR